MAKVPLLILDELGYVPFSKTGAELPFEALSQRYEGGSVMITPNLPFEEWTQALGSERLTGALLDFQRGGIVNSLHHVKERSMLEDEQRAGKEAGTLCRLRSLAVGLYPHLSGDSIPMQEITAQAKLPKLISLLLGGKLPKRPRTPL